MHVDLLKSHNAGFDTCGISLGVPHPFEMAFMKEVLLECRRNIQKTTLHHRRGHGRDEREGQGGFAGASQYARCKMQLSISLNSLTSYVREV